MQGPDFIPFRFDLGVNDTTEPDWVQPVGDGAALTRSVNTRLGIVAGAPRKSPLATLISAVASTGDPSCGGIIPCGNQSSSLIIRNGLYGAERAFGSQVAKLKSVTGGPIDDVYWSAEVTAAGAAPHTFSYYAPATCLDSSGNAWFASVRADYLGELQYFVSVLDLSGKLLAGPTAVWIVATSSTQPTAPLWCGLTAHGANGVRFWHRNDVGDNKVRASTLTVANGTVTLSGSNVVYTPSASATSWTFGATKYDDTYAFVLTMDTTGSGYAITKYNVATSAVVSTLTAATGGGATGQFAIATSTGMAAGGRVAVICAQASATHTAVLVDASTNTALYTVTGAGSNGDPFVGFYRQGATEYAVFGVSKKNGTSGGNMFSNRSFMQLDFRPTTSTSAIAATLTLPWMRACSRMAMHAPSSLEVYPVILTQTCWNSGNGNVATSDDFLSDPFVDLLRVDSTSNATRIGRFGVDRAQRYPGLALGALSDRSPLLHSDAVCVSGSSIQLTYLEDDSFQANGALMGDGSIARYVRLSMAARQPRFALSPEGPAVISGAMPCEWDGTVPAECAYPVRPKVHASATGGAGANWPAGNYEISAAYFWRDSAGVLHRGFPAEVRTVTMSGSDSPIIYVSSHMSMCDAAEQGSVTLRVYVSQAGQTVLYAQLYSFSALSSDAFRFTFDTIAPPVIDATTPAIYTTAGPDQELPAQQPNALADVAVVRQRAWAINAERPYELWYSKRKQADTANSIAFEWSSDQTITLAASTGGALAVAEYDGNVLVFCRNGVWEITGEGPDADLTGSQFNDPEQVSDVACTQRSSVIRTPAGIYWVSNTRFAAFGQNGAGTLPQKASDPSGSGVTYVPVLLRKNFDAVWLASTGEHVAYNYERGLFTTWGTDTVANATSVALDPVTGLANVAAADGSIWQLDEAQESTTAQIVLETGHIMLGNPESEAAVESVLFRGRRAGAHGLNIVMTQDYGAAGKTIAMTPTDVANSSDPTSNRYTLSVSPKTPSMRAVRLSVSETGAAGLAMVALSCVIVASAKGGSYTAAVRAAGRK